MYYFWKIYLDLAYIWGCYISKKVIISEDQFFKNKIMQISLLTSYLESDQNIFLKSLTHHLTPFSRVTFESVESVMNSSSQWDEHHFSCFVLVHSMCFYFTLSCACVLLLSLPASSLQLPIVSTCCDFIHWLVYLFKLCCVLCLVAKSHLL